MKLSILNLNCWLLPPPFSVHNKERLNELIRLIKKLNPDIVTLQEIWLNKHIRFLKENLNEYHITSSKTKFYNQSGLVTLTKSKPLSTKIYFFEPVRSNIAEVIGKKGYLIVDVPLPKSKLSIINTHLYTPLLSSGKKYPERQFEIIKKITGNREFLVAGDFNIDLANFTRINRNHFKQKCGKEDTLRSTNLYSYRRLNRLWREKNKKIDYILLRTNKKASLKTRVIKNPIISNHFGMFATLIN